MMRRETDIRFWAAQLPADGEISAQDIAALLAVPIIAKDVQPGEDIFLQGSESSQLCLIFDGLLCSYDVVGDGLRQINAFHLAGDIPDLGALHFGRHAHSMAALRPSRVGFISPLQAACAYLGPSRFR